MLSIGIVNHISRSDPPAADYADFISTDDGTLGCTANHLHVLRYLAKYPTSYTVVLEDDAIPADDFTDQLHKLLPMAPSPIVSLYMGKKRPPHWELRKAAALSEAHAVGASWIISTHLLHAVGYAIRTDLIPSLLQHSSRKPIDEHITDWAKRYGHLTSYTYPSVVDHQDGETTFTHQDRQPRQPGRKAWAFGTRTTWTTEAVILR